MAESTAAHATPQASAAEVFRPSSHWTAWGQWLALFTMTVDHLTRYVLPGGLGFRLGRLFDWAHCVSAVCRHGGVARLI